MASGTLFAQVRIQPGAFLLLGKKLAGGVKSMRRKNNYPGWARVEQKLEKKIEEISKCRKLSDSGENTLFHILKRFETNPYPYTLSKTLS